MQQIPFIKRTTTADADFQALVKALDTELWDELNEDQATYDQYNKVPDIRTAVLVYMDNEPAACGCFKPFEDDTVEIKRMYVTKNFRRLGLAKLVLNELETWAKELEYRNAVLETSIHFKPARGLYEQSGYAMIPNYGQYADLPESVCMKKNL